MSVDEKLKDALFIISIISTVTAVVTTVITAYFKIKNQVAAKTAKQTSS